MPCTPRPFATLYNRSTRYEVAIYDGTQPVDVVAFTAQRTRRALLNLAAANGEAILAMMTEAEKDQDWRYDARAGRLYFGARASIGFTGSTEYERASCIAAAAA